MQSLKAPNGQTPEAVKSSSKMSTSEGENQQKKLKTEEETIGDRISSLSDDLLHNTLSFMHTKYAVQTCVLSRRWKHLWKSLPYLDFNHQTFPFNWRLRHVGQPGDDRMNSLNNFISQVLFRRHHTDLVKVCFQSYPYGPYLPIVQGLMAYAVDHNVQQLTIQSGCNYFWEFVMPRCFYTCKSLTALQLLSNISKLPHFLALPALKSLHLHRIFMTEKNFNPGDFSACPNLETLKLVHVKFEKDKTFFINAPNLKRLELSWCKGHKVVIDAPGLMTFQYCTHNPLVCLVGDLGSIEDACFDCYPYGYKVHRIDKDSDMCFDEYCEFALRCINTVKKFHQAKSLTVSWKTVGVLSMFPSLVDINGLPFSNLKYLKINLKEWQRCKKLYIPGCVLNFFLNNFPVSNLKFLRIDMKRWQHCNKVDLNFVNCFTTLRLYK